MSSIESAPKDTPAIDGAIGAAVVDAESAMTLNTPGVAADLDLPLAAAASTDIVRVTRHCLDLLGQQDQGLEDTLVQPESPLLGPGLLGTSVLDQVRQDDRLLGFVLSSLGLPRAPGLRPPSPRHRTSWPGRHRLERHRLHGVASGGAARPCQAGAGLRRVWVRPEGTVVAHGRQ